MGAPGYGGVNYLGYQGIYRRENAVRGPLRRGINDTLLADNKSTPFLEYSSKLGYPIYYTLQTIGNYSSDEHDRRNMQVVPYYYIWDRDTGTQEQVAVWAPDRNGKYQRIDKTSTNAQDYKFITKVDDIAYNPVASYEYNSMPYGTEVDARKSYVDYLIGYPSMTRIPIMVRTNIGKFNQYVDNVGSVNDSDVAGHLKGQRWFGVWNLPATTRFKPYGDDSADWIDTKGKALAVYFYFRIEGDVWTIEGNSDMRPEPSNGTVTPPTDSPPPVEIDPPYDPSDPVPERQPVPPTIVIELDNRSSDDVHIKGTW